MRNITTSKKLIKNTQNFFYIKYYSFSDKLLKKDGVFFGLERKKSGKKAVTLAKKQNSSFVLLEDGFIRSLGLGVNGSPSFSLVEDNIGIYYDATTLSKLENILNEYDFKSDEVLMKLAKEAMAYMREHHISKYNNAPNIDKDYFKEERNNRVLIVAQTNGDSSLEYGLGNRFSTQKMIDDAFRENPNASVYLKIHPDVLSGKKGSDISVEEIPKECKIIEENINPISLLKHFKKVYTKTSGMGMEALILGLDVVCYGVPFYAGWGLTIDKQVCKRRNRRLTLEELFAGAYILYTRYHNPYEKRESDIMDTMFEINRQRDALDNKKRYDILAIGDSHIRVFEHKLFSIFTNKKIKIVYVPGASSYGILNSNSLTGAYKKIEEALEENIYDKIIITLGEVDCSYTLWMLAENKQRDIDELLDISISRYITFLEKIKKYAPLYLLSASLPTIRDFENCDDSVS